MTRMRFPIILHPWCTRYEKVLHRKTDCQGDYRPRSWSLGLGHEFNTRSPRDCGELTSINGKIYDGGGTQMEFLFDRGPKDSLNWEQYMERTNTFELEK